MPLNIKTRTQNTLRSLKPQMDIFQMNAQRGTHTHTHVSTQISLICYHYPTAAASSLTVFIASAQQNHWRSISPPSGIVCQPCKTHDHIHHTDTQTHTHTKKTARCFPDEIQSRSSRLLPQDCTEVPFKAACALFTMS